MARTAPLAPTVANWTAIPGTIRTLIRDADTLGSVEFEWTGERTVTFRATVRTVAADVARTRGTAVVDLGSAGWYLVDTPRGRAFQLVGKPTDVALALDNIAAGRHHRAPSKRTGRDSAGRFAAGSQSSR